MKVAITGVGAITGLGRDARSSFDALCAGESALTTMDYPGARGPTARVYRSQREWTSSELAVVATSEAMANFDGDGTIGVVGASTSGDMSVGEEAFRQHIVGETLHRPEDFLWSLLCHRPTQAVRAYLSERGWSATGPCQTLSTACTSGTCAVGTAADWLRQGHCDVALAVGTDALCITTTAGFGALGVYAQDPCRPFDAHRRGMNIGEGAGALLLEPLDRAIARGVSPLAIVAGYGNTSDAHHLTAPSPEARGAIAAIEQALGDLDPSTVGYVNAHATGTLLNDAMEALALTTSVPRAPVSGIKGAIGHTLGAAGAIEAVITTLALHLGRLPPNVGCTDPGFDLDLIDTPRNTAVQAALSVNFAFGGHNAALLLARADS